jgi:hypothetical protein
MPQPLFIYQSIAQSISTVHGPGNAPDFVTGQGTGGAPPVNPEIFARPFPVVAQQFEAHLEYAVPFGFGPFIGDQHKFDFIIKLPTAASLLPFDAPFWQGNVPTPLVKIAWPTEWSYKFARPFPIYEQQWITHLDWEVPVADKPGWRKDGLDYAFKLPFPVVEQQFLTHLETPDRTADRPGWRKDGLDYAFTKPFPVSEQKFDGYFQPIGTIISIFAQGYHNDDTDNPKQFAKPFQAYLQQYEIAQYYEVPTTPTPQGFWGYQFDYAFLPQFPVAYQVFSVVQLLGEVPPFLPPGSGRRYKPPTDYLPEPPWDEKANKPFKPVWDRGGKIEQPRPAKPAPPPLPPLEIFGKAAPLQVMSTNGLPTFREYVPDDSLALAQRMQDALDESDAVAALRALGLLKGDE